MWICKTNTTWSNLMNADNTTNSSFVYFGFLKEKKNDIWLENALQSQQEQEAAITQSFLKARRKKGCYIIFVTIFYREKALRCLFVLSLEVTTLGGSKTTNPKQTKHKWRPARLPGKY